MTNLAYQPQRPLPNLFGMLKKVNISVYIVFWVFGLWAWSTVLSNFSGSINLILLIVSLVPATILFWNRVEFGVITLMFFTSGFIATDFVDVRLPIGGGFEMRDILLFLMLGITFFQRLVRKRITIPWWPVGGLLLIFFAFVIFSMINSMVFQGVSLTWALSDARILFFYLIFFIVAWGITSEKALDNLIFGTFVIVDITAMIVILQQTRGPYDFLLPSMNGTDWLITLQGGVVRVVPPGIVHIYMLMLVAFGYMIFLRHDRRKFLIWLLHFVYLGVSLIFTFTRASWVATGITLFFAVIILFPIYRPYLVRLTVLGLAFVMFIVGFSGIFLSDTELEDSAIAGIIQRFTSIFDSETTETLSLQWRVFEIQEVTKAVQEQPLTGVGVGNSYRNITFYQRESRGAWVDNELSNIRYDRFTRYAHSSYYAIVVKLGFPGLIALLIFCLGAVAKSLQLYFKLPTIKHKGTALMVGMGMFGLLQWSFLHSQLMLAPSTAVVALAIGMLAAIHNIFVQKDANNIVELNTADNN